MIDWKEIERISRKLENAIENKDINEVDTVATELFELEY